MSGGQQRGPARWWGRLHGRREGMGTQGGEAAAADARRVLDRRSPLPPGRPSPCPPLTSLWRRAPAAGAAAAVGLRGLRQLPAGSGGDGDRQEQAAER